MKLGLKPGTVSLQEHNSQWKDLFEKEKQNLKILLSADFRIIKIEHIGSTSIPNIKAKPIIDILLVIDKDTDTDELIVKFETALYHKCSFQPQQGEVLFKRGDDTISTHYIHAVLANWDWQRYLLFKNYLLQNPSIANEYEQLKIALAEQFKDDRRQYTAAKEAYVENILNKLR